MSEPDDQAFVLVGVPWNDARATSMREQMDAEIQPRYADREGDPEQVKQALTVDPEDIVATLIAVAGNGTTVGHAALRQLGGEWEIKRLIVDQRFRGNGLAVRLMTELEVVAMDAGAERLILQTGDRQPEAVALYQHLGYTRIPIYDPYTAAIPYSRCFEKHLDRRG